MTTGVPVVPEELWMRMIFSSGTACSPNGYASRKSAFSENDSFSKSSWDCTSDRSMPSNFMA